MTKDNGESLPGMTLVIPTYNRANLILETINAALAQTHSFAEVIVVDDGSIDNTQEVLAEYHPKIRVIKTDNRGVQEARNTGVAASSTDLVALCDSDDLLEPHFVKRVLTWMNQQTEVDVLYSNFVTFGLNGISRDKFSFAPAGFFADAQASGCFLQKIPDLYERSIDFQPLFCSGIVFRKRFFDRIGGFNTKFNRIGSEDWEFTLRAISEGNVAVCTDVLCRVRRHAGNDSQDSKHMNLGEAIILEYGLVHHRGAIYLREKILRDTDQRRKRAFDIAFANANLIEAKQILALIRRKPRDYKFLIKEMIVSLPKPLQTLLYRLSQFA